MAFCVRAVIRPSLLLSTTATTTAAAYPFIHYRHYPHLLHLRRNCLSSSIMLMSDKTTAPTTAAATADTAGAVHTGKKIKLADSERDSFMATYDVLSKDLLAGLSSYNLPENGKQWVSRMLDFTVPGGKMNRGTHCSLCTRLDLKERAVQGRALPSPSSRMVCRVSPSVLFDC
ncbi:hypothetical protein BASA60_002101 [Batrachochytrium salamandrivorans]|nr:hypothetical protein BASA60_002101 [Batrachochytrium salamandrivorans]